jgi:uncharacterized repeat protein (TIGR04076 family)
MLEEAKRELQKKIGITDEDFAKHISFPHNVKMLEKSKVMGEYQIIAEAVQSKYCSAGVKAGTKLIFDLQPAMLISRKSDCPLCARAIYPVCEAVDKVMGRIMDGLAPETVRADCRDPGLEKGGLGHVVFKVYARKK